MREMEMSDVYTLRVGDDDHDNHSHCYITVSGWRCQFNKDASEYFELSGICKPERAQAIVQAANSFNVLKEALTTTICPECKGKRGFNDTTYDRTGSWESCKECSGYGEVFDVRKLHAARLSASSKAGSP
jgi:hypothetical protein